MRTAATAASCDSAVSADSPFAAAYAVVPVSPPTLKVLHRNGEVEQPGGNGSHTAADALNQRDLRDNAGGVRNALHQLSVCQQRARPVGHNRAGAVQYAHNRRTRAHRLLVQSGNLGGADRIESTLLPIGILREGKSQLAADRSVAAKHSVIRLSLPADKRTHFDKGALVKQRNNRRTTHGVLLFHIHKP